MSVLPVPMVVDRLAERLAVYVVLDADTLAAGRDLPGLARASAAGGARTLQVRAKTAGGRELYELVAAVAAEVPPHVVLLVNDRVDVAAAARFAGLPVAGVHVGRSDLPPAAARAVLGPGTVLGLSVGTVEEVRAVAGLPLGTVDYLGISPVRPTTTKPDADLPVGVEGAAELAAAAAPLPCVGIGGLTAADAGWMRTAGLAGMAVVSAVSLAADPQAATARLAAAWAAAGHPPAGATAGQVVPR